MKPNAAAIRIDGKRLARELDDLGKISAEPFPVVTRVVYTEADLRAREFVKALCKEAGLAIREDAVGNTFARWLGSDPTLAPVGTGSHIDAIPNAGRFDGTVGVLGGLEAIRALQLAGVQPTRSIELLIFTSEEPTRFGIGCFGSRLLAGVLGEEAGKKLRGDRGESLDAIRTRAGFHGELQSVRLPQGYYSAFVELHIEQGPILEQKNLDIGIVTAIAAPATLHLDIEGEGGHAGAVSMTRRRDAFLAAAEIALVVEAAAKATGAPDTVGTTGICDLFPRAVNSIPSRAHMEIDIRDIDGPRRDSVLLRVIESAGEITVRRNLAMQSRVLNSDPPARCDPAIVAVLQKACQSHGVSCQLMISRAYHDSLFMSLVAPTSMIFVPCRDGISHRPDEYSSPEAIARGTLILAEALRDLATLPD